MMNVALNPRQTGTRHGDLALPGAVNFTGLENRLAKVGNNAGTPSLYLPTSPNDVALYIVMSGDVAGNNTGAQVPDTGDNCKLKARGTGSAGDRLILMDTPRTGNISGTSNANPDVITTSAAHGLIVGDQITITGVVGDTAVNVVGYDLTEGIKKASAAMEANKAQQQLEKSLPDLNGKIGEWVTSANKLTEALKDLHSQRATAEIVRGADQTEGKAKQISDATGVTDADAEAVKKANEEAEQKKKEQDSATNALDNAQDSQKKQQESETERQLHEHIATLQKELEAASKSHDKGSIAELVGQMADLHTQLAKAVKARMDEQAAELNTKIQKAMDAIHGLQNNHQS